MDNKNLIKNASESTIKMLEKCDEKSQERIIRLGYNAVKNVGRRQAPRGATQSEDNVLKQSERTKLLATSRDIHRNTSLIQFAVNKHVDYTANLSPFINTKSDELDKYVLLLLERDSKPHNFDALGRHSRQQAMRIFAKARALDGDSSFLKTENGMQGIEGDRIKWPDDGFKNISDEQAPIVDGLTKEDAPLGLIFAPNGRIAYYILCKRVKTKFHFETLLPANSVIYAGSFNRFDQSRGISIVASVINTIQDLNEGFEGSLLKIKLQNLMGIAITRDAPPSAEEGEAYSGGDGYPSTEIDTKDIDKDGVETDNPSYDFAFGSDGPTLLDMDPGDGVMKIETSNPAMDTQSFWTECIRLVLLGFNMPYTFYSSKGASYATMQANRVEYENSIKADIEINQRVLEQYSDWRLEKWLATDSKLARLTSEAGLNLIELQEAIEWASSGIGYYDKAKEIGGDLMAAAASVESLDRVARRRTGQSAEKMIEENAVVLRTAEALNVPLYLGSSGQVSDTTVTPATEEAQSE